MAKEELVDRSERREHPRYAVNLAVEICIDCEVITGQLVDISIKGMRISLPRIVKPSTDMVVTFSAEEEVRIFSHAVWTLEKNSSGLPAYLVGLKIHSIMVNNHDMQGMAERIAFLENLLQ